MIPIWKNLQAIGAGDTDSERVVADWLRSELMSGSSSNLDKLMARAAMEGDNAVSNSLDRVLDKICVLPQPTPWTTPMWHCLAITLRISDTPGEPSGPLIACTNSVAAELQVDRTSIHCHPQAYTPEQLFGFSPQALFALCYSLVVCWEETELGRLGLASCPPVKQKARLSQFPKVGEKEIIFFVGVKLSPRFFWQKLLKRLSPPDLSLPLSPNPRDNKRVGGVPYIQVGLPWSTAVTALHCLEVQQFMDSFSTLRAIYPANTVFSIVAAYVEESTAECHSLRLSVLDTQGCLAGGYAYCDLHEPSVFLLKLDVALKAQKVAPLRQMTQTYFSAETDDKPGDMKFFVPGKGWQRTTIITP
ncbi:MAG: hypothetical protein Q7U16_12395 [Agitococcus sp.]|nr:hypothetical protein [Agitococcus sp.]